MIWQKNHESWNQIELDSNSIFATVSQITLGRSYNLHVPLSSHLGNRDYNNNVIVEMKIN